MMHVLSVCIEAAQNVRNDSKHCRRVGVPMEYGFTPLPDGRAYFSLCIEI